MLLILRQRFRAESITTRPGKQRHSAATIKCALREADLSIARISLLLEGFFVSPVRAMVPGAGWSGNSGDHRRPFASGIAFPLNLLTSVSHSCTQGRLYNLQVCVVIGSLLPAAVLLLLDRGSKRLVRLKLANRRVVPGPRFRIRFVANFKRFYQRGDARIALVLAWSLALMSAIALHHTGRWFQSPLALAGLGLAFGGALGNLLDILRYRCVVDFVDLRWWPVFNFADVGIVAGLALAFLN